MDIEKGWRDWQVSDYLGEGSFGKVYKIIREEFGHTYESALKVIRIPQSRAEYSSVLNEGMNMESVTSYFESMVEDIVSEFALMSRLRGSSNIVSYEDHSVERLEEEFGWEIFIRMELLTPLFEYLNEHTLKVRDIIKLGIDMCKALEICQKNNIIHRDIKPENIFYSDIDAFKLGDFGIARQLEKTSSGMSKKGTYTYMAPEVYKGLPYNSTVDIYSLGIVLYRFLNNNRAPFMPPYPEVIKYSDKESANVLRMSGKMPPLPCNAQGRLGEIVLKACAYEPKDRYATATEMRVALESIPLTQEEERVIYPIGDALETYPSTEKETQPEQDDIEEETTEVLTVNLTEDSSKEESTVYMFDPSPEELAKKEAEEKAQKEAEEKARKEAEERRKKEAEEQTRREAEEKARREEEERKKKEAEEQARREEEERARREEEERKRKEAEEKARIEAEERARREEEERKRKEAEEKARKEAEEKARREEEERKKKEAEEKARIEAEEKARREEEERKRKEAEEKARIEAEEKARREEEERKKKEAEEKARKEKEEQKKKAAEEKKTQRKESAAALKKNPKVWIAAAIVIVIAVAAPLIYSYFNQEVPALTGLDEAKAKKELSEAGLKYKVEEKEFSKEVARKHIISQNIKKGKRVKKGTVVKVVVSKGIPIKAPNLTGKTEKTAKSILAKSKLKLSVEKEDFSYKIKKGCIIKQDPGKNVDCEEESTIKVTISKGARKVTVPKVKGLSKKTAIAKLKKAHLKAKIKGSYSSVKSGRVISQSVKPGRKADEYSRITLKVSIGPEPEPQYQPEPSYDTNNYSNSSSSGSSGGSSSGGSSSGGSSSKSSGGSSSNSDSVKVYDDWKKR